MTELPREETSKLEKGLWFPDEKQKDMKVTSTKTLSPQPHLIRQSQPATGDSFPTLLLLHPCGVKFNPRTEDSSSYVNKDRYERSHCETTEIESSSMAHF